MIWRWYDILVSGAFSRFRAAGASDLSSAWSWSALDELQGVLAHTILYKGRNLKDTQTTSTQTMAKITLVLCAIFSFIFGMQSGDFSSHDLFDDVLIIYMWRPTVEANPITLYEAAVPSATAAVVDTLVSIKEARTTRVIA